MDIAHGAALANDAKYGLFTSKPLPTNIAQPVLGKNVTMPNGCNSVLDFKTVSSIVA